MFWQEDSRGEQQTVPGDIMDLSFSLICRHIPVDHAYALSTALRRALPWLDQEPQAAIHLIYAAGSQNGWTRPRHSPGEILHLSHRAKLSLRLPQSRLAEAEQLTGTTLDIAGHPLTLGKSQRKPLSKLGTLFARHIACDPEQPEEAFLQEMALELAQTGVRIRKALCGMGIELYTPDGPLFTRSLMLADLPYEESIRLQQRGIGHHRLMGCGIFIPHKDIDAVNKSVDDGMETPR
ncbi:MAG: type I-MYXAN CRISPR-associated protein Cas6/Cmx6 [Gammaproteobacteria bacterium RIFOXYA12_FULL_61_12]|nr:MAG: type I-MYXAN CRISPR-associated protein Cas6/Cmx6 [Gammaproteobacteria bacterium RIFOXYD12_FULL_61_37]OGT93285.1 MAG: type I-MYXAN CRISPR-associated protein Cas6/Cmx6 [Gammaproteobacteria bacterium RIFOXYA12_FULL_61_12]